MEGVGPGPTLGTVPRTAAATARRASFSNPRKAQRLSAMSQEAPWQVFENPDYAQHSASFRREADALARAAKKKNIDAATLAYMRLTMNCVDCHKFVRGKLVAQTDPAVLSAHLP